VIDVGADFALAGSFGRIAFTAQLPGAGDRSTPNCQSISSRRTFSDKAVHEITFHRNEPVRVVRLLDEFLHLSDGACDRKALAPDAIRKSGSRFCLTVVET
jgi:hypothetical protein